MPGGEKEGGSPHEPATPQKLLSSSQQKGTGKLTSDTVHPGMVRRGVAKEGQTIYEYKQTSSNADDRAEARMAARLSEEGYDVHFRANDKGGDLEVEGVRTEVKHSHAGDIANQMRKAAQQGVDQVIIDGSTVGLTEEQVRAGIDKYEGLAGEMVAGESRVRNPKMRDLKTAFIVTGDGTMYIYHRGTSLRRLTERRSRRHARSSRARRRRRMWLAKCWPKLRAYCRTVWWLTMMPRAASNSSTM